ncbi:hypothetical protein AAVH_14368 [Aphelenchoides avenae]|nr:hypothetical protein AAVH_14368 [Aphelenchus avenae]
MRALLLVIAFYSAIAEARFIHVEATNGTIWGSAVLELDEAEVWDDAGKNHLTEKDVDDVLFFVENSKNFATSKAAEEALEKRNPELMKKLQKFEREVNATVNSLSLSGRVYAVSVIIKTWADITSETFSDILQSRQPHINAEKALLTLLTDGAKMFKKLDSAVQTELADAFPLITDLVRSEKFHAKFAEQLDAE